jgi:Bap31/Bap29 transmembrane region
MILVSFYFFWCRIPGCCRCQRIMLAKVPNFIDAINRLQRPGGLDDQSASGAHMMHDMRSGAALAARKFYAQRNL